MAYFRCTGGGGSAPVLITKNITQNGTYNASADSADGYSQVKVEVSGGGATLGEKTINTYGVYNASDDSLDGYSKVTNVTGLETATASGAVASISDAVAMPCPSVVASIVPVQSGSGTPSPSNVRPISGFSSAVLTRDQGTGTTPTTYTASLGRTVYGGSIDFVSGQGTSTIALLVFDGTENFSLVSDGTANRRFTVQVTTSQGGVCCSHGKLVVTNSEAWGNFRVYNNGYFGVLDKDSHFADAAELTTYLTQQYANGTPLTVAYILDTAESFSITPQAITTTQGVNNFYADTGDTSVTYYREKPPLDVILEDGVVSDTSAYRTATFSDISGYSKVIITFKWETGEQINGVVYDVSAIGSGINFGVSLQPINVYVNFHLTTTSIASTQYGGDYHNIYATIQGIA